MVDFVKIRIQAGDGGDGLVAFRKGRGLKWRIPDGGNGGEGGSIFLVVEAQLNTLLDFRRARVFRAQSGKRGGSNRKQGARGKDLVLKVPLGTLVLGPSFAADLTKPGERLCLVRGGRGGRGNAALSRGRKNQRFLFGKGEAGEGGEFELELKLVADVGLVGLPNVGKTLLLNRLTAAKAKVADYPFTTLEPNLGVIQLKKRRLVLADVPGLIAGASQGKGLGESFLRHIQRTRLLLHVLAPEGAGSLSDYRQAYATVWRELITYDRKLAGRKELLVVNKMDWPEVRALYPRIARFFASSGKEVVGVSALTGEGLAALGQRLVLLLKGTRAPKISVKTAPLLTLRDLPASSLVVKQQRRYTKSQQASSGR